jgi:ketosteroid isomerase-like protein
MKHLLVLCFLAIALTAATAQDPAKSKKAIMAVLHAQETAWNAGDIEGFMQGYWQSDSLKFIGSNGLNYGWSQTLDNYRKHYPDVAAMGKLSFSILSIDITSPKSAFVVGKWHLAREHDEPQGYFTLLWKLIKGKWVIVADHTS